MKQLGYLLTLFLLCGISFSGASQLLTESFETDGEGSRYTSNNFTLACNDFFARVQGAQIPGTYCITNPPSGQDGTFFWGGEDTDQAVGGEAVLTLNSLAVTGFNLDVDILLAHGRPNDGRCEVTDYFILEYNMDGGGWNAFGALYGNNDAAPFNGNLQVDTDLDGSYNVGAPQVNSTVFQNFNFTIPVTGNSVQVRIRMLMNAGTEETVFDNIRINGTAACTNPTIPTVTQTPATICTGGSASLNISGTLNDATAWHVYTGSCGGTQIGTTATGAFAIPGTITAPTTYFVRGEGGCVTPGSCGTVTITPQALDDASFSYSAAAYCVDASDPTPTITGLAGGTFSSTAGLSLNAVTGAIDVSTSTPGTYTVTYTTAGTCPNSSNVSVTINALDDPSFSYSAASYCSNDSDPTPTITGLAGGTFSSTAGLSLNAGTGAIDVSASTPGTYTVTYTTTGACPNSSVVSVTINAVDDASFSYSAAAYCVDDTDPTPTITGLAGGGFSSTAGLSLNAVTGAIDVSTSTPGTYTVTYTTAGTCPNSSNVSVTINALDDA